MNGIIVEEYQNVFNKDTINLDKTISAIDNLIYSFNSLKGLANSNDSTRFLSEKNEEVITQLNNVKANIKDYHSILRSVYTGYKQQSDKILEQIQSVMPNN